jgi:predicted metalloprotease
LLAVASLVSAGCGDDEDDSQQPLTAQPIAGDVQGVSLDAYEESVDEIVVLLEEYWAEELPETLGVEYSPPDDVIPYDPAQGAPKCGGEPLGAGNAFYCPGSNIIAWDEPGLMIPFYAEVGDAAVGFVLAHEWGHLVQNQVEGPEFQYTIEGELNADCLGGTFARALYDEGLLEGGTDLEPGTDLAEAAEGIFLFGDAPATPWQDPSAHGSGKQRLRAFEIGFDGGVQACADELGPGFAEDA